MDNGIKKGETLLIENRIKNPIQENVELFFNHFGRYFHASRVLRISEHDVVVDASCGCGYGSCGLAMKAKAVYGLDVNESYLRIARQNLQAPGLHYMTYNEFSGMGMKNQVSKIVCIETFEHIPREQGEEFLQTLVGYLTDMGSMFLTSPLGNNGPSEYNPVHCFEPSIDVLHSILSRHFANIQIEVDTFVNCFGRVCEFASAVLRNKK